MFDSKEELLEKITLGEDSVLELKAVRFRGSRVDGPSRDDLADELAAIANSHDAVVVLGVDDRTREILGIPHDRLDLVETFVRETCQASIKPPLVATIIRMRLPASDGTDRAVIKIDVPRSLFVHKSPGGYFHRLGSSKRELSTELLMRLGQQRSQTRIIRFDEQGSPTQRSRISTGRCSSGFEGRRLAAPMRTCFTNWPWRDMTIKVGPARPSPACSSRRTRHDDGSPMPSSRQSRTAAGGSCPGQTSRTISSMPRICRVRSTSRFSMRVGSCARTCGLRPPRTRDAVTWRSSI